MDNVSTSPSSTAQPIALPSENECKICLAPLFGGGSVVITNCRHTFHDECITRWLDTSTSSMLWDNPPINRRKLCALRSCHAEIRTLSPVESECKICHESLNADVVIANCGHPFHHACISQSLHASDNNQHRCASCDQNAYPLTFLTTHCNTCIDRSSGTMAAEGGENPFDHEDFTEHHTTFHRDNTPIPTTSEEADECTICCETMFDSSSVVVYTGCGHRFHHECISQLLDEPINRRQLCASCDQSAYPLGLAPSHDNTGINQDRSAGAIGGEDLFDHEYFTYENYDVSHRGNTSSVSDRSFNDDLQAMPMASAATDECQICYEPMLDSGSVFVSAYCEHRFHHECISQWLDEPINRHQLCAICDEQAIPVTTAESGLLTIAGRNIFAPLEPASEPV